jgi:hypothetical protein
LSVPERPTAQLAEGIDPCHSHRQLNQFPPRKSANELSGSVQRALYIQVRSRNSEIYLQQGSVRHAVFDSLEGEAAVAEIFRWRQGRFYFEEGIISRSKRSIGRGLIC